MSETDISVRVGYDKEEMSNSGELIQVLYKINNPTPNLTFQKGFMSQEPNTCMFDNGS